MSSLGLFMGERRFIETGRKMAGSQRSIEEHNDERRDYVDDLFED